MADALPPCCDVCFCLQMVDRWPWRMLCRRIRVLWWMLCHRDRVAWLMLCHLWLLRAWRMLCRHSSRLCCYGRAFRWMLRHHLLLRVGNSFLCRSSSSGGLCLGGLFGVSSPSVFLLLSVAVCEFVCIFSSVFLFC